MNFSRMLVLLLVVGFVGTCANAQERTKSRLLVLNKVGNSLSIMDKDTLKVLSTVAVGDGPHEVVVTDDGTTAYVTNYGGRVAGSSISVIDIAKATERRVSTLPLMRPHGIQIIGGRVYFSAEANNAIGRYDPASNTIDWVLGTGQLGSHMVAGSADQKRFYTPNIGSDTVTMFELAAVPPARNQVTQIKVGKQPEAIDLSPDEKEVWVGLNTDLGIDVIDTATKKVTHRIDLGARPYRVMFEPSGKKAYATIFATKEVVEIDAVTKKILRRLVLKNRAFGIIFSKDSKFAYVTTFQEDGVVKIDLEKFEVIAEGAAGANPDGIAIS